jgi:hypothetical protein
VKWMDSASVLQKVIGIASGSSFDCGAVSEAAEIGEAAIEEMPAETVAHEKVSFLQIRFELPWHYSHFRLYCQFFPQLPR